MITILKSSRNKDKANLNGFTYNLNRKIDNKYYWCCEKKIHLRCGGRLITIADNSGHSLSSSKEHSHQPDPIRRNVLGAVNNIESQANISCQRPNAIIRGVKRSLSEEVLVNLPASQALAKRIKRRRSDLFGRENISGTNFEIPSQARQYNENEPFLLADNNNEDNRIIVFGTNEGLKLLHKSRIVVMDGTFKSCPLPFSQLYTLHVTLKCQGNVLLKIFTSIIVIFRFVIFRLHTK